MSIRRKHAQDGLSDEAVVPILSGRQAVAPNQVDALREQLVTLLPKLLIHAMRLTRSKQVAEDLVQRTCLRAIDRLGQWNGKGRFEAWVARIMETLWFTELRKKRQRQEQEIEDPDLIVDGAFERRVNAKTHARYAA